MTCPYEHPADKSLVKRPYRIWNAITKSHCQGRQYASTRNAQDGALLMIRWERVGAALEVYNIITGRCIGQYVRKPNSIAMYKE